MGSGRGVGRRECDGIRASAHLLLSKRSCFKVVLRFSAPSDETCGQ